MTLREALRLATGDLAMGALSAAEAAQVTGTPGPDSSDTILFDGTLFPIGTPATITVQPPPGGTVPPDEVGALQYEPRPSLPPMSTGMDVIDASDRGVILTAGLSGGLFDGIVINVRRQHRCAGSS